MRSAGLLPYRIEPFQVLIAHPGGPFFRGRDEGAWSLVKGMVKTDETDEVAAMREFEEETGWPAPRNGWVPLGETTLRSRKVVIAWAVEQEFDLSTFDPGTFTMHGREYPEIDRVEWSDATLARYRLNAAQGVFVARLEQHLGLNDTQEGVRND